MNLSFGPKRLAMIGAVFGCAFGAGFLMQNVLSVGTHGDTTGVAVASANPKFFSQGSQFDGLVEAALPEQVPEKNSSVSEVVNLEGDVLMTALPVAPVDLTRLSSEPVKVASSTVDPVVALPEEEAVPSFACEVDLTAQVRDAAMVSLELDASCLPNERFTLHHSGMMVSGSTDEDGRWSATVPALSENAFFIAAFPNRDGAVATVQVAEIAAYDRYVVQWQGDAEVQIHAFEKGASYEDAGHVWNGAHAVSSGDRAGFLTRLADPDLAESFKAEVYSIPSDGSVGLDVNVEVVVGRDTCGQDLEAQAFWVTGSQSEGARDLMIAMPDCGAVGEYLVLKNLFEDLTIARN